MRIYLVSQFQICRAVKEPLGIAPDNHWGYRFLAKGRPYPQGFPVQSRVWCPREAERFRDPICAILKSPCPTSVTMHERTEGEAIESGFSHLIHFFMTIVVHSDDFDDNLGADLVEHVRTKIKHLLCNVRYLGARCPSICQQNLRERKGSHLLEWCVQWSRVKMSTESIDPHLAVS
jgi:hypothetical protein